MKATSAHRLLPFKTFGEAAAFDLEVEVSCQCRRRVVIDGMAPTFRDRRIMGTRFRCTTILPHGVACRVTGAILNGSFVSCFSEHDPREDIHGRLSMWRAYCNPTGLALVFNSAPFFLQSDVLKAYSSPVTYLSDFEFNEIVHKIAANVVCERDLLSSLDRGLMVQILVNMFKFAILCTKHPAFAEEKEWRIAYTPGLLSSGHLTRHVRTLKGVTQPVYDLPLKDIEQEGLVGIEIPQLVHKIIIGPTQYLAATHSALCYLLEEAGVSNPGERIVVSEVPLRT